MIRLISATTRTPIYVDPTWVSLVAYADGAALPAGASPRARILVDGVWIDVLETPQLVANSLGKPSRHVPVADLSEVLKWAEAFFEQSADDDATEEEHDEREEGVAALDRVKTWLAWER